MLHPRAVYRLADRSISFNATTTNYGYGALNALHVSDVPTTFIALIRPTGSGEGGFSYIASKVIASSATGMRWFVDHNGGSPKMSLGYASGVNSPQRSGPDGSITYGRWVWVACTFATGLTAASIKLWQGDSYLQEVASYSVSTDGSGSFSNDVSNNFHIGNRDGVDRTFAGDIALVARWNDVLDREELNDAIRLGPASYKREKQLLCWVAGIDVGPKGLKATTLAGQAFGRSVKYRTHRQADYHWLFLPAGGGGQTITPSGIASEEAFGTTVFTTGAVSILPSGIESLEAFGTTVVSPGAVSILPSGIASLEEFGTTVLSTGAVSITPSGIASLEAFGDTVVNAGGASILPSGISSLEAFGSHTVTPGAVTVTVSGIVSAEAFGSHVVSAGGSLIFPSAIDSLEAFGSHTVTPGAVTITCTGIATGEVFGDTVVSVAGQFLFPSAIATAEAFGSHTLSVGAVTITCSGIASAEMFGTTVVSGGAILQLQLGVLWALSGENRVLMPSDDRVYRLQ